ncbi:MAG: tripartite tricarboxylate transporter permease [Gemmatimonadetes bacterium]|nr:tripartite tricarboxylate transporter permease [Gemmatimonadota bacterium]
MDSFRYLIDGFGIALQPVNLFYCMVGVLWGTVVGVLPGLGPLAGLALLLPLTYQLEAPTAIIMLAGIFYGAMYGGSTTSILLKIPGEAASVITCIDGHEMAKRGRAGPALVIAAVGSWFGGTVSVVGLMLFAPPLAELMLAVGPAGMFSLMVLALVVMSFISAGSALKTFMMIMLGLLLGTVGLDGLTGHARFTFGSLHFVDGVSFVAMAIGLFGVSEILLNLEDVASVKPMRPTLRSLVPNVKDLRDSAPAIGRGTVIGFLFGIVPGISHVVSTFVSYAVERKLSSEPEAFGTGKIEGVAGPETANNATTGSAMIPLLVLGIPAIPATAILLSALMIHGIEPGPQLIPDHPEIFWGLIASMYIGNLILLILNVPLVGIFVSLLRVPYAYLGPLVLAVSVVGVYSVNASSVEIWLMTGFGVVGYLLRKFKFDVAPLLLAVVLGDRIELSFRRSLTISDGDYSIFFRGTVAQVLLGALVFIVLLQAVAWYLGFRKQDLKNVG